MSKAKKLTLLIKCYNDGRYMTISDFFFVSAGMAIWIMLITWLFIFYKILILIAKIQLEVSSVKNIFKFTGMKLLSKLLGLIGKSNSGYRNK